MTKAAVWKNLVMPRAKSLAGWSNGKLLVSELDPSAPSQDFVEAMFDRKPRWRLVAYDEGGVREELLDTLLCDPVLLVSDEGGIVVGETRGFRSPTHDRFRVRSPSGQWTAIEGVRLPSGLGADALWSSTATHVTYARRCRPESGKKYTVVERLDRRSCKIELLSTIEDVEAIAASNRVFAWAPHYSHTVMTRLGNEPITRFELPSCAKRLSYFGDDLVIVLETGFAVVHQGRLDIRYDEVRFIQVWPTPGICWYGLVSGVERHHGSCVERVGAYLCRIRGDVIEPIWAEVPSPIGQDSLTTGAATSLAIGRSHLYFVHEGRMETVDIGAASVQPLCIAGDAFVDLPKDDRKAAFWQSCARRNAYWMAVGTLENDMLAHAISPSLRGGPAWPTTRQNYRVIRRPGTILIATDGMSDPFEPPVTKDNGFGMELFIETADIAPELGGTVGYIWELSRSWAFELLSIAAGSVAQAGGIKSQLKRHGVLSMEFPGVSRSHSIGAQLPARFVTADDCVGILLGVPVVGFPTRIANMPLSPVSIVPVTLITAEELEALRQGGAARGALVERLAQSGRHHLSNL
jgi:hypothetical protein